MVRYCFIEKRYNTFDHVGSIVSLSLKQKHNEISTVEALILEELARSLQCLMKLALEK